MQKKTPIVPITMWIPLFLTLTVNCIAYNGTRLIMEGKFHFNIATNFDEQIPFLPWTIIIYWGCYVFWIVNYIIGCRQDREKAFQFMSADLFAKIVCMVFFIILPTTNIRPLIEGTSIWDELMRILYRVDAADNLFPSIHCLTSWFCFIAVRDNEKIPKWYKVLSFFIALSICVSTLTTKQHVLIDVIAGVVIAEGSYMIVSFTGFSKLYAASVLKTLMRIKRRRRRLHE